LTYAGELKNNPSIYGILCAKQKAGYGGESHPEGSGPHTSKKELRDNDL
jgi:hypothetical protein